MLTYAMYLVLGSVFGNRYTISLSSVFKYFSVNKYVMKRVCQNSCWDWKVTTFGMMQEFIQWDDWLKILTNYGYANDLISDLCYNHIACVIIAIRSSAINPISHDYNSLRHSNLQ